jgi:hypothetical protein
MNKIPYIHEKSLFARLSIFADKNRETLKTPQDNLNKRRMPLPPLTIVDGHWKKANEDPDEDEDQIFVLMAEISKSGRARCRRCSEKIANKTLRLGTD